MTESQQQTLKALLVTLLLLFVGSSLLFADQPQEELGKSFVPDTSRPMTARVHGDAAEVSIGTIAHGEEGRARYRYYERRFSGLLEWDAERNLFQATVDMNGLNFDADEKESESDLELLIPAAAPVDLEIDLKAGVIELDGSDLNLSGCEIDLWGGELTADFPKPLTRPIDFMAVGVRMGELTLSGLGNIPFRELDINGFAGQTTLDFSGSVAMQREVRVDLEMGEIEIIVPRGMQVEARIARFIAEVDLPSGWRHDRRYASTPGTQRGEADLYLDIRGGVGSITIRER